MAKADDFSVFSVLVTGSDRGIGLGLVKRFLELPCPPKWVFATTLDLEGEETKELRELACKCPNLVVLQLDVTKLESIQAALKEVEKYVGEGGLTILYNNAGIWTFNDLQTENAKDMMRVYSVDTIGPLQMSQAFLPLLKKAARRSPCQGLSSSKAAVINMSSTAGSIELMAYWDQVHVIGYRCAKAALNMLTKCQSLEYPADGIMSVAIHPGSVKTANNPIPEISVEESTRGIMTVLSKLCEEDNGTFLDFLAPGEMAKSLHFCVFSVLVTGSHRGIGLGLVKRFLKLPCPPKWVFADLEGEETKEVKELACKHPNLVVLQLDVTKLESIQAALKEVEKCVGEGGLTLLVNNAVTRLFNDFETENGKNMMTIYSTNTIGPLQMSQAFLPLLKKAARRSPQEGLSCSKAAIINTSSSAGSMEVMLLWDKWKGIGYRCSKAALNMLTRCQSLEYPRHGILSVCIHPGWVKTKYKDAVLTVEESTEGIMSVLSVLSEKDNGTFVDWLGRQVPWCSIELMERWDIMQRVAYRCSKTALNMLTKCQSLDYSSHGILCVALHPGSVKTPKREGDTSLEESTQGIITVLSLLSDEDNGTFVDWLGRRIPW
ncbi:LOW QUALITY PROTEIN: uncharacterized protein M6D78_013660 [Vipera latastei]